MVPGGGFEPPTRGFSIHCSTPELLKDFNNLLTQTKPLSQYSHKGDENWAVFVEEMGSSKRR